MAVTAVFKRTSHTETVSTTEEFGNLLLTGTYATGGFTLNPFTLAGGPGTSALGGKTLLSARFTSPTGYIYTANTAGNVTTVKILSAPATEIANGTAVPDASVPFHIIKSKV